ncbi:substrate-binding domain-containing protein [uncultured Thiothrix sp.]|uniref:substrate-binding domain-containing protein n=1 Tax=uncultured Thiothrix sp. TaxID=223185 RepID=UPI00262425D2|nr:substrate-binding domain-containing protein [uncultured Thiothrix sp.]HMT93021.1 substrate-binding domain-containing protein [Thiolinea sp.]
MRKLTSAILLSTCLILPVFADEQKPINPILKMATTTSTQDSGLLNELLPAFQKKTGYEVQVTAVGTGKALKLGENGDVDVVLVHARADEDKFVEAGFGDKRYSVMYNDFIFVGPAEDPAKVQDTKTTADALKQIAETKSPFVSRGDDSGTHKMEKKLWEKAGVKPEGEWYREAGQGMGEVLQMSGELKAYTLTDRGTWLATMDKSPLKIVLEGDKTLMNPYGIIAVSQKRYPDVNHAGAQALIEWLVSVEGQKAIGDYKINGQALFTPSADAAEAKPANEPVKTN